MRYYLLTFFLFAATLGAVGSHRTDSLLRILDNEILSKDAYDAQKRREIRSIQIRLDGTTTDSSTYAAVTDLFNAYKDYSMDTSLIVARCARRYARRLKNDSIVWRAMLMEAEALKGMGRYDASLRILDSLPSEARVKLHDEILNRYCSIYYTLADNTVYEPDRIRFRDRLLHYRDSLARFSRSPEDRAISSIELAKMRGDYDGAIRIFKEYADSRDISENNSGLFRYIIGEAYAAKGDTLRAIELYTLAAIDDLRANTRKYNALPALAALLYSRGDVDRAFDYIMCSLGDVRAAHARSRLEKVVDTMPIISQAYAAKERRDHNTHIVLISALVVLSILLVGAGILLFRKNNRLSDQHRALREHNEALTLQNERGEAINEALGQSKNVREEQIGQLFNLCSEYIDLMANQHLGILKAVKSHNLEAIEKATTDLLSPDRLRKFFNKFDQTFLAIFPGYVDLFNSMLKEDCREVPPADTLTPEMRIFALMRLGITDTARIAGFLHYSTHTVYNYRFRLKARTTVDMETFTSRLMSI